MTHRSPGEIIQLVRRIRPTELDDEVMFLWLATLECRVFYEVLGGENIESEELVKLLVGPPHDEIYWTYLVSMVDFAKGDMQAYAQSSALAEKAWKRFVQHYHQKGYGCIAQ